MVMIAALALCMGIAAPAWAGLADPMAEDYTAHVIPFYKIDDNWSSFLVVADTSFRDLDEDGSPIYMTFYKAKCNFVSDAIVEVSPSTMGAQLSPASTLLKIPFCDAA